MTACNSLMINGSWREITKFSVVCPYQRTFKSATGWLLMCIPAIVDTPEKRTFWSPPFHAQVVTMGQLLVFRECRDDNAGSLSRNTFYGLEYVTVTKRRFHREPASYPSFQRVEPVAVAPVLGSDPRSSPDPDRCIPRPW